jgi:hypothetical protein
LIRSDPGKKAFLNSYSPCGTITLYGNEYGKRRTQRQATQKRLEVRVKTKKLTLEVPQELLEKATHVTGEGITPTIRKGLELVAASGAYAKLRSLKGKVKFSVRLSELRED